MAEIFCPDTSLISEGVPASYSGILTALLVLNNP
jgi:hypothetical protein